MRFTETKLKGAWIIALDPKHDERGWFARTFCTREFEAHGLHSHFVQCNLSLSKRAGTLRGLHYQEPPASEVKLVRCVRGAIFDVVVDVREDSPTFGLHCSVELTEENGWSVYVPALFAHGFQTLTDHAVVHYQMSAFYNEGLSQGVRYDDPALQIPWPLRVSSISDKDRAWPWLRN